MSLYTGIIEGLITYNDGAAKILPFQDSIEGVQLQLTSTQHMVETYSADGIKGASAACPNMESAEFRFNSKNIAWAFLQAATGYLDQASTDPLHDTYSVVLSAVSGTAPNEVSTLTLPSAPASGTSVLVSDIDGLQYEVTVSGSTVTFDDDYTGTKVTVHYFKAVPANTREINFGSGTRLGEIGVYGRFKGCPGTLYVSAKRGVIESNVNFQIGSEPATAELVIKVLRDEDGIFVKMREVA